MSDYLIEEKTLTDIADSIRDKTGLTIKLNPEAMNEAIDNIITLAEGSQDATATAAQILKDKTAYVDGVKLTGTMTDNGAISKSITPSTTSQSYTIPAGYHNGSGKVTVNAAPTSLIDGDATAANVLTGKTFFVDSYTKKTGTMTDNGAKTASLNCGDSYTIPAGYHNGSGKVTANTLASQTSADATAAQILSGKTAWVNGSKITGTIASQAAQTITPGTSNKTIAAGKYLSGKQTIKGDANLIPENILEGISIFGVLGTASGGEVVTGTCGGFSGGKFVINEAIGKKNMIITINNPGAISSYEMLCASYINGQTSLTYASRTSLSYFYVDTDINQGVSYNPDTGTMTVSRDIAGASHTQLMDQVYRYFAF